MKNYAIVRELRPQWNETETRITELMGGLVNRSYLVETGEEATTVRFPGRQTGVYIDRQIEKINVGILAGVGIAPRVREFREDGTMIRDFVRGTVATKESFKDPNVRLEAIKAIRQLHESSIQLCNRFDVFDKIREYRQLLNVYGPQMLQAAIDGELLIMINRIEGALANRPRTTVPCHNDLLPGNFVLTDYGTRIIDWEYAGMNDARYEIANHVTELDNLAPEEEKHIMTLYFGENASREQETVDMYKLPSRFLWALWAGIQYNISGLDFDFMGYAHHQFDRCSECVKLLESEYPSLIHN